MDMTIRYPHELERKRNIVAFLTKLAKPKYKLSPRANNWVRGVVSREYQKGDSEKLTLGFVLGREMLNLGTWTI